MIQTVQNYKAEFKVLLTEDYEMAYRRVHNRINDAGKLFDITVKSSRKGTIVAFNVTGDLNNFYDFRTAVEDMIGHSPSGGHIFELPVG